MDYKNELNAKQYEAVTTEAQFVRIIAGAGSGKTRVLTFRMAYLIDQLGIAPYTILAITFTNKAAGEMRNRVLKMLPNVNPRNLFLYTFHAFCAYFLRREIQVLEGYTQHFTIYDEDDQKRLVKDIAVQRGHEKRGEIIKRSIEYISQNKSVGKYPADIKVSFERVPDEKEIIEIWKDYERALLKANALDFDDLMLKALLILENNPLIKNRWTSKFAHLLVDEFQDTNEIQYRLIKALMNLNTSLYVVGDPDQTIYTWRGADDKIILDLDKNYNVKTILLNENYRSTQSILNAANTLISKNKKRIEKDLYTNNGEGDSIITNFSPSNVEEANWVVNQILALKSQDRDFSYRQVVILLRANYLTLNFEKALMRRQIAYQIYGGTRFYQRKEIKDATAYFRLLVNEKDDVSFERIANIPRRGLSTAIEDLKQTAILNEYSLFESVRYLEDFGLKPGATILLKDIVKHADFANKELKNGQRAHSMILQEYLENVGYIGYIEQEKDLDKRDSMLENLQTLYQDIDDFMNQNENVSFIDYLANATLLSAQDEVTSGEYVTIMTVHMAKGLEYDYVFLVSLNQGVFPNSRAISDGGNKALEEERRLCYVAITRAKKKLYISCNSDYNYVIQTRNIPSSFFAEAGLKTPFERRPLFVEDTTTASGYFIDPPSYYIPDNVKQPQFNNQFSPYQVDDLVKHVKFGIGTVVKVYVNDGIIDVDFQEQGIKKLLATFKGISKISKEDLAWTLNKELNY